MVAINMPGYEAERPQPAWKVFLIVDGNRAARVLSARRRRSRRCQRRPLKIFSSLFRTASMSSLIWSGSMHARSAIS